MYPLIPIHESINTPIMHTPDSRILADPPASSVPETHVSDVVDVSESNFMDGCLGSAEWHMDAEGVLNSIDELPRWTCVRRTQPTHRYFKVHILCCCGRRIPATGACMGHVNDNTHEILE